MYTFMCDLSILSLSDASFSGGRLKACIATILVLKTLINQVRKSGSIKLKLKIYKSVTNKIVIFGDFVSAMKALVLQVCHIMFVPSMLHL